jgi:hypothetical protein
MFMILLVIMLLNNIHLPFHFFLCPWAQDERPADLHMAQPNVPVCETGQFPPARLVRGALTSLCRIKAGVQLRAKDRVYRWRIGHKRHGYHMVTIPIVYIKLRSDITSLITPTITPTIGPTIGPTYDHPYDRTYLRPTLSPHLASTPYLMSQAHHFHQLNSTELKLYA